MLTTSMAIGAKRVTRSVEQCILADQQLPLCFFVAIVGSNGDATQTRSRNFKCRSDVVNQQLSEHATMGSSAPNIDALKANEKLARGRK
jgi:hypothetical protein